MITGAPVALPGAGRKGVRVGAETFCTTGTLSELDMLQVSGGAGAPELEDGGAGAVSGIAPGGALGAGMSQRRAWALAPPGPDRSRAAASRAKVRGCSPMAIARRLMLIPRSVRAPSGAACP